MGKVRPSAAADRAAVLWCRVLCMLPCVPPSHPPLRYFDGRWMTKFRGHYCVDGGVMAFIPTVPDTEYTVKVRGGGGGEGAQGYSFESLPCALTPAVGLPAAACVAAAFWMWPQVGHGRGSLSATST